MKKIAFIFNFIALLFITSTIKPEIAITNIKGLGNILQPDTQHLSPLFGGLLWYNEYPRNIYEFGNIFSNSKTETTSKNTSEKMLALELFSLNKEINDFKAAVNNDKIGYYLNSSIIGQIIGLIENFIQSESYNINEKLQFLFDNLHKNLEELIILTTSLNKDNTKIKRLKKELKEKLSAQTNDNLKNIDQLQQISQKHPKLKPQIFKLIDYLILKLKQKKLKESFEKKYGTLLGDIILTKNTLKKFEKTRTNLKRLYITKENAHRHINLLLSFLWTKEDKKENFINYFWNLYQELNNKKDFFLKAINIHTKEDLIKIFSKENSHFNKEDFILLRDISKSEDSNLITKEIINNFENLIFFNLGSYLGTNNPLEITMRYVYYKLPSGKKEGFPDCGETSIRNFLNALLWIRETEKFDINLLKKITANQKIISFYEELNKSNNIYNDLISLNTHNQWTAILSGLPNGIYKKMGVCEIMSGNSGIENIMIILKNILIIPDKYKDKTLDFESLSQILQKSNITIQATTDNGDKLPNDFGTIILNIKTPNNELTNLEWIFEEGHFEFNFPAEKSDSINYKKALEAKFISTKSISQKIIYLSTLLSFIDLEDLDNLFEIISSKGTNKEVISLKELALLSTTIDIYSAENQALVLNILLKEKSSSDLKWNEIVLNLIIKLIKNSDLLLEGVNDSFIEYEELFDTTIQSIEIDKLHDKKNIILKMSAIKKAVICASLFNKIKDEPSEKDKFKIKQLIEDIIKTIEPTAIGDSARIDLINNIINNKSSSLYAWAKQACMSIKNKRIKESLSKKLTLI